MRDGHRLRVDAPIEGGMRMRCKIDGVEVVIPSLVYTELRELQ